jgi:hypothetical protein
MIEGAGKPEGNCMSHPESNDSIAPSQRIADYIGGFADWRGALLARLRTSILDAAPGITYKPKGVPPCEK